MTREEMRDMVAQAIRDTSEVSINRNFFLDCADAAIALVLEEAAKVAMVLEEDRVSMPCPDGIKGCVVFHFRRVKRPRTALEIAAAIRALKEGK